MLFAHASGEHAHGVGKECVEFDRLVFEADAPGFDLRHVKDVVDDIEQIAAAAADVAAVFEILGVAKRAEHS